VSFSFLETFASNPIEVAVRLAWKHIVHHQIVEREVSQEVRSSMTPDQIATTIEEKAESVNISDSLLRRRKTFVNRLTPVGSHDDKGKPRSLTDMSVEGFKEIASQDTRHASVLNLELEYAIALQTHLAKENDATETQIRGYNKRKGIAAKRKAQTMGTMEQPPLKSNRGESSSSPTKTDRNRGKAGKGSGPQRRTPKMGTSEQPSVRADRSEQNSYSAEVSRSLVLRPKPELDHTNDWPDAEWVNGGWRGE
jgi:hypothetical protein